MQIIRSVPGGARADYGLQKVFFPVDARGEEALTITTPDGRTLTCRATFLAAHDLTTDQRWLIAEVTNRIGTIAGPDQVIYTNAFDTITADIRYRYTKYSLEQDIILHENLVLPKGFSPATTRLEFWSEWFGSEPKAKISQSLDLRSSGGAALPALIEDQTVDFGAMKIGAGHAFSSTAENERTPVGKLWERIDGRDWLIEVVDYQAIQSQLEKLPNPGKARTSSRRSSKREQLIRSLAHNDRTKANDHSMLLAQMSASKKPEFVLDFVIVSSVPVPSGVVSWWPGGGNANDAIVASGNDGAWLGTTAYGAGKVGQGFTFDGISNIEISSANSLNPSSVTVEAWIKPATDIYGYADLISKDGEWSERQYFLTYVPIGEEGNEGVIRGHVGVPGGLYYIDGETSIFANTWNHIAMTYNASSGALSIYVNGQLDVQGFTSGAIVPTTQPVRIGGGEPYNYAPYYFTGTIDEPAIYNRALSGTEIQAIYNAGVAGKANPNCVAAPANIMGWWPGDGNTYDLARTSQATWHGASAYSASIVSDGFQTTGGDFWFGGTWLEIPDRPEFNPTDALTLEAWVYATDTAYGHRLILGKDAEYAGRQYLLSLSDVDTFRAHVWAADGTLYYFDGGTTVDLNTWYHVVMTYNRNQLILYVNGVQDGITAGTKAIKVTTQPLRIGAGAPYPDGAPYSFPGIIDEPTIYNRALSSAEVTSLYYAGSAGKCKTDTDHDGLTDLQESFLGTSPTDTDSDDDGLTDGDEVFVYGSNPLVGKPTITISANDPNAAEPSNTGQYTINRTGPTTAALPVYFSKGGNTVSGTDYNLNSTSPVNIPIGSASVPITLTPVDNATINGPRNTVLSLTDNAAYVVGTRTATVVISDDELPTVSVSVSDPIVYENGTENALITLTRTGPVGYALPVAFTMSGAVNGTDYATVTSPVTIPIGAQFTTVVIDPIDNAVVNLTRTASLTISPNSEYIVDASLPSGSVLILDNELPAVTVSATDAAAQEPANSGNFRLTRSQNLSQPLSVFYKLGGAGRNGKDYQALIGKVDFVASQTTADIIIQPIDNTRFDGTRDVILTILPGMDYVDGSPASATVQLADDEVQQVQLFASVDQTKEATTPIPGVFTFKRFGSTRSPLTVSFTLSGAVSGTDYQALSTSVTFPADASEATLNVVPINDTTPKGTRNLQLTISANAAYTILPTWGAATVKIMDNDLPTVTVEAQDATASETAGDKGTFRFKRTATDTSADLKVYYEVYRSDPLNLTYNNFLPATTEEVVILANTSFVDVDVVPVDDTVPEYTETVTARVMGSTEYLVGTSYRATVNVLDNEPLVYSWEATRPYGVSKVDSGHGLPVHAGVPGEITIRRVGLLPTSAVTMSFYTVGNFFADLTFEGNVLTQLVPSGSSATPRTLSFPAGVNEVRIPIGRHVNGGQSPAVSANGQVYIQIPTLFGSGPSQVINFVHPGKVFSIAKISTHVAEGSAANLFRISRTVDGFVTPDIVEYTVSGTAFPVTDHNLAASGSVTFAVTERSKDISIQGLADARNYEGWETVNIALNPKTQNTVLGSTVETQVFIRDSTQPVNAVPPVDTDQDGLTDAFETQYALAGNALNPNVANLLGTDTDHDGASDLDEQTFGLNPNLADTDGDGVSDGAEVSKERGFIANVNTVPIKFAVNSCFKCHQTTLQAGPYQVSSKPLAFIQNYVRPGSTPGTDPSRVEKIFNVEVGKSYPVEIQGEIRKDVLNALAAYTAEILPADPGHPTFILEDANGLLGSARPTSGIDTKTATLIVPKVEVTWLTKPGAGNVEIDDNPFPGVGNRIFVGSKSPNDIPNLRNTIMVKVKTTPELHGKIVTLKVFDVDDATDPKIDVNAHLGPDAGKKVINLTNVGNDNGNPDSITLTPAGEFIPGRTTDISGTLDGNGELQFEFRVSMQPGNNFRIAATIFPVNNAALQLANLNRLTVTDPAADFFVPSVGEMKGNFNGVLSPLLTVWRKLNLEFDSMGEVAGNYISSTIRLVAQRPNQTTVIELPPYSVANSSPIADDNQLEQGKLQISGVASPYSILSNNKRITVLGAEGALLTDVLVVDGLVPATAKNAACTILDDDDRSPAGVSLDPPLPKSGTVVTITIVGYIQPLFSPAFIQVVDANAAGWNPRPNLPFGLNQPINNSGGGYTSTFDDFKDLSDSGAFWSHLVCFGYQPEQAKDGDPDGDEDSFLGLTAIGPTIGRFSVVYVETIRDDWMLLPNKFKTPSHYWSQIYGVVAHETGHSPSGVGNDDHVEGGMMAEEQSVLTPYAPQTIKRFRSSSSWSQ